jgi:hypothetical protein
MLMLQNDVIMIDAGKLNFRGATAGTFVKPGLVGKSTWAGHVYLFRELVLSLNQALHLAFRPVSEATNMMGQSDFAYATASPRLILTSRAIQRTHYERSHEFWLMVSSHLTSYSIRNACGGSGDARSASKPPTANLTTMTPRE